MNVIQAAQITIQEALEAEATLTAGLASPAVGTEAIYADLAPQGTDMPYVTHQFIPGGEESRHGTGKGLVMVELTFLVKVVTEGTDQTVCTSLAEIVDQTLEAVRNHEESGWVFDIYRRSLFYLPLFQDSTNYRQAGGRYTVIARPAL